MPELALVKRPDGLMEFLDEDQRLKTLAIGEIVNVKWSHMRNGAHFRQWVEEVILRHAGCAADIVRSHMEAIKVRQQTNCRNAI